MTDFLNAAPMVIDQGTRDLSQRVVPASPLSVPQHLAKIYGFFEKGPIGPSYMDFNNASLTQVYGDDGFDVTKKYYSHQTPFLQAAAGAGNNCVVHRLVAPDANDVANVALYLDFLPAQVPLFQKNDDGSLVIGEDGQPVNATDSTGNPVMVAGHKVSWVIDSQELPVGQYQPGLLEQRNGLQVDGGTQSKQIPIFELAAADAGEGGNKLAAKLFALLQSDISPFPSTLLNDGKMYPYNFQMVKTVDPITGKTNTVLNSFGAETAKFVVQANGIDPASGAVVDMTKVVTDQYIDLPTNLATGLGTIHVYQENLDTVLGKLYDAEKVISDEYRDNVINNSEDNRFALNVMSFTSSNGSPYQTVKVVDTPKSVRLTKNTNLFLSGSSDGTISNELLDSLVAADLDNYNNSLHEYNDLVMHPESIIYDSGFALATKKAIPKFISRRKDTFVALSTFAWNAPSASLADQYSVGVALKTILELYPESSTFGTPVMRGIIIGGSGTLNNSLYTKRVPLTYELMYKAARYMGASNGAWKNGFCFDKAPLSVVTQIKNIDVTWVPTSTRNTLWAAGLNFVLNYQVRTQFFPALHTVYENDTSVLNSFFTAMAIAYLNKVSHAAWREFSGSISLTNAQLEEQVNLFVANQVKDKFDNKFVVIPNATVTELDNLRGYSWTLPIKLYANNMKTVMTTYVEAYRMSDLEA